MKIENPYTELMEQRAGTRIEGCWSGWEEGYHSRDEVVDRLVEACREAKLFTQNRPEFVASRATMLLTHAIAKARP